MGDRNADSSTALVVLGDLAVQVATGLWALWRLAVVSAAALLSRR